jgi:hypothetical protein
MTNTFFAAAHLQQKVIRVDLMLMNFLAAAIRNKKCSKLTSMSTNFFAAADPQHKKYSKWVT